MLIDFEGLDGSGKCTQSKMLEAALLVSKQKVKLISYPKYTSKYGKILKEFLFDKIKLKLEEQALLYILDMLEDRDEINDLLDQEYFVILDRYYPSTLAYQSALGLNSEIILSILSSLNLHKPSIGIYLEISPNESICRKVNQNVSLDKYEKDVTLLEQVSQVYKRLISHPSMGNKWITINGNQSKDNIHKQLIKIIERNCDGLS